MTVHPNPRFAGLIGDRPFYREFFAVAFPIILQQVITTAMGFVDSVMVGQIGAEAMAGVTISNKYFIVLYTVLFGVTGGFGIFTSQYFGAGEHDKSRGLFLINAGISLAIALLFLAVISLAPRGILRLFLSDPQSIDYGLSYLRAVRFSYLPFAVSMACMYSMRSIGQTRSPMLISSASILLNSGLNYLLIFGAGAIPALGVRGAGLATLIARIVEMAAYILLLAPGRSYFHFQLHAVRRLSVPVILQATRKTMSFTGNELLWSLGMSTLFWAYCMVNETYIAALTIAEAIGNFIPAIFGGISAAVSVQIGTHLGAGRFDEAKRNAGRIIAVGMAIAFAIGCVVFLISNQIPQLFKISPDIRALAASMLRIQAVFYFLVTLNVTIFLIVRIGGDIKAALFIDSAFVWFGVIPLALLLSLVVKPPMLVFYLCIQLTELAKAPVTLHFLRHGRWVRNLT